MTNLPTNPSNTVGDEEVSVEPSRILDEPASEPSLANVSALVDQAWRDLLEKDDRTSPSEYPEMVLITHDELAEIIFAAASVQS